MRKNNTNESGFTIIEVVLVLAIAGLIFLVVFLALPQLQRSRRDTARRDQVGRVIASLTQAASNSNGQFPSNNAEFVTFATSQNYFGACTGTSASGLECESLSDPSEGSLTLGTAAVTAPPVGTIFYSTGAACDGSVLDLSPTGTRQIAVVMGLEQGGSFCQDNSN